MQRAMEAGARAYFIKANLSMSNLVRHVAEALGGTGA